jgi:small subunit ribosomal protein S4
MARDRSPVGKQSRREGVALHPKAVQILLKKAYAPGQHGQARRFRQSEYGVQLRDKQKLRRSYGLLEKQFRNLVAEALRAPGQTGQTILKLLELRLDNVVYRAGLANSRRAARQLVNHGHFTVNGRKNDIPSARVKIGDEIEVKASSKKNEYFKALNPTDNLSGGAPSWIKISNKEGTKFTILTDPALEALEEEFEVQNVVEFYSRLI